MNEERNLTAGPIRCKLVDGELRYLTVGDKEVVRRVYFAVRNGEWATAMPRFSKMEVKEGNGGFTVSLAADCRAVGVDYSWSGTIEGKADGTITFRASGQPNADFNSNLSVR